MSINKMRNLEEALGAVPVPSTGAWCGSFILLLIGSRARQLHSSEEGKPPILRD